MTHRSPPRHRPTVEQLESRLVLDAKPRVPVVFIPGFAASVPTSGKLLYYTFHRGVDPTVLELSKSYAPLVNRLTKAGYVEGETFFGAAYDWRMFAAPDDGNFDGTLSDVTAASITDGTYAYAIDYLGYWLDRVVQANLGVAEIDMVTHSTGGILARAYMQSPAYGATYVDANGDTQRLPTIRRLVLGADPNLGTVHSWGAWNNDFQDVLTKFIPTTEFEARLAALAYTYVVNGGTIPGPDHDIALADILNTDVNNEQSPDATTFFRLYTPLRQSLMPTFDFLVPSTGGNPDNVNNDPSLQSFVLLDLNATSSQGDNPWAAKASKKVIATFATGARQPNKAPLVYLELKVPGLVLLDPPIKTLYQVTEESPGVGSYLPLTEMLKVKPEPQPVASALFPQTGYLYTSGEYEGDGNGTFGSYDSTLEGDPNIRVGKWGDGLPRSGVPADQVWTHFSLYPIYHDVFFANPDVDDFVVRALTGERQRSGSHSTNADQIASAFRDAEKADHRLRRRGGSHLPFLLLTGEAGVQLLNLARQNLTALQQRFLGDPAGFVRALRRRLGL